MSLDVTIFQFSAKITSMPSSNSKVANSASQDDQKKNQPVSNHALGPRVKEQEIRAEEDQIMTEIHTTAEAYDRQKLSEVEDLIKEAKRVQIEPKLPADVEDAGVVHPQSEAEKVVQKGSTLELSINEETYRRGFHQKVIGTVVNKVVVGVSSLAALAMWIGRALKMAHIHAKKVIWRRD